jgi:t-SNARE complex subunit (syntaxin)
MAKSTDDVFKEITKINKDIHQIDIKHQKDLENVLKSLKNLTKKVDDILSKIQELEVIMDAAEFLEEHLDAADEDEGWNPYNNEYEPEEFEDYGYDSEEDDD